MASYGPGKDFSNAEEIVHLQYPELSGEILETKINSYQLEHSFIGILGKAIEPAITPLGYDWKIGIALISSFAAREVFVGTLATIYSVENGAHQEYKNNRGIRQILSYNKEEPKYSHASEDFMKNSVWVENFKNIKW